MNNATNISRSADAAYNKRLEESAHQLTLAMAQIGQHQQPHPQQDQEPDVNNSDGSGYNSEEELSTSGEQENEDDLLSYKCDMGEGGGEPSSLSSSSLTSENENDDESSSSFSDGIERMEMEYSSLSVAEARTERQTKEAWAGRQPKKSVTDGRQAARRGTKQVPSVIGQTMSLRLNQYLLEEPFVVICTIANFSYRTTGHNK